MNLYLIPSNLHIKLSIMSEIGIFTTAAITILGVAYPILFQVIARLDEKYASDNIVELFNKEKVRNLFIILLGLSLLSILVWPFQFQPWIQIKGLNFIINNSASLLVVVSTTALVVCFFLFVKKILIYYTPSKFITILMRNHSGRINDFQYFNALIDVFLISIRNQNKNISLTLSEFFYSAFQKEREGSQGKPIEYPDIYYSLVHRSIEELAIIRDKRNHALEYITAGGIWLLGETQGNQISEKTYSSLWSNLLLAINYEQDDMVLNHWETAHRYFAFNLDYVYQDYDYQNGNMQVRNQSEVEKRDLERKRFLEFHYALGGLLTYKNRYAAIGRTFNYTTSDPPSYELLPDTMNEIFKFYFKIRDPFEMRFPGISNKYPFPEQSGLRSDSVITKWISTYLAILFLRQYTIYPYLSTMRPLDYPDLPPSQGGKREWIEGLDFFKNLISKILDNEVLIKDIQFGFITREWCNENGKIHPIDFIDNLKRTLETEYQNNALIFPISIEKVKQFERSTNRILEATLREFISINNNLDFDDDTNKWYVNGQRMLQSRDAFSETPEIHHIDFDTFLASSLSEHLNQGIASTFLYNKTKSYLFKKEDVFKAIEKLSVKQDYQIICFGVNLGYYLTQLQVTGLSAGAFNGQNIYSFPGSRLISSSFFLIKKDNLPRISTVPISDVLIKKYSLEKVSEEFNIFTSVIDLNATTDEIRTENSDNVEEAELRKSVLLSIIISTEIKWKKGIDLIRINEYSEYKQKGIPNSLNEL